MGATQRRNYSSIHIDTGFPSHLFVRWQNRVFKTKTSGNSKSVGKQLYEERYQDAHLLPGPEEREQGYIVNIDL